MDSLSTMGVALILALLSGALAAILTTWIIQQNQRARRHIQAEIRRRELLYSDFIAEAYHLFTDTIEHSLKHPSLTVKLFTLLSQVHFVASQPVGEAAEKCYHYLADLQTQPNLKEEQIHTLLLKADHPIKVLRLACYMELNQLRSAVSLL